MTDATSRRAERAREIAERHRFRVGGALRSLIDIVAEEGYVDRAQEHVVADVFNLSRAEVRGIVSFYHDLKTRPQPPLSVRICQAEACQSVGSAELTRRVEEHLGVPLGETGAAAFVDAVYCLGLCAQGPSMLVNGRPVARADTCDLGAEFGR